ncbi:MAG: ATP-binding cassette domain-containing protein, partial [archaeon]
LKKKVGECSYGETRRIEFACALSSHSNIIILDEPFSGLDMKYCKAILCYLKTISEINNSIIIITSHHSPDYYDLEPNLNIKLSNNVNSELFSKLLGEITTHIIREKKNNKENISISEFEIYRSNNQILNINDYTIIADKLNWFEGENGAGKTTLMLFLAGLISNSRLKSIKINGNIIGGIYDGWNIKAPNNKVRVLLQNPYKSFLHNYVLEDIPDVPKSILKILSNWGNIARTPYSFSFGQLKILQFLLIPTKTDVILFDEPLLGLHPNLYSLVIDSLNKIVDSGRNVIACSESNFINLENYSTNSNLIKLS